MNPSRKLALEFLEWLGSSTPHAVDKLAEMVEGALDGERERMLVSIGSANRSVAGISTPLMYGDNLAVFLCSQFDDGEPAEDDTGWSPAAIAGYKQVIHAIREHYSDAITPPNPKETP